MACMKCFCDADRKVIGEEDTGLREHLNLTELARP